MARINLSISNELKARMDKHPGVNWSQTASKHFESDILKLELTSKCKDMTTAIARLKASKQQYANEMKEEGFKNGHQWASETASYEQLKTINDCDPQIYNNFISEIIKDDLKFKDSHIKKLNYDEFIKGFRLGALEVFSLVNT